MIPVIILCGGFGTRLQSVLPNTPKVLAPINGQPFLSFLLEHLRAQALLDRVILSTGHLSDQIEDFVISQADSYPGLRCIKEPEPLGTAGAVKYVVEKAQLDGPFLIMNGDTWFNAPIRTLATDCLIREPGEWVVALTSMRNADRFGLVEFDASSHHIEAFKEKQQIGETPAWINAGVYLGWSQTFNDYTLPQPCSTEHWLFPALLQDKKLYCRSFSEATFLDIGIPEDYQQAEQLLVTR